MANSNSIASSDATILRICRTCGIEQPISNFYFTRQYPWKDCKSCEAVKSAAKRNADPERFREKARATEAKRRLNRVEITQDELKKLVTYDTETGLFSRIVFEGNCRLGDQVGSINRDGYVVLRIRGEKHMAHRLAWLYVHGRWPEKELDHINRNRSDNRISNLREANRTENVQNTISARKNNKSGYLGVSPRDGKWRATIYLGGKKVTLGYFDDPAEAHQAYLDAKKKHHPSCTF